MEVRRFSFSTLGWDTHQPYYRRLMSVTGYLACICISLFIIWTTGLGKFPAQVQYSVVLNLGLVAVFMLRPGFRQNNTLDKFDAVVSSILAVLSIVCGVYYLLNYQAIAEFREGLPNQADLICYFVGFLLVLEGARRTEGLVLLSVVLAAICYLLFGNYLPGVLHHRQFWFSEILEVSYSYQGIFGIALGAVVDVVYVFVILGVALRLTGAGDFFNYIAMRLTRGMRSGPAQCAIIASALFGSINGSAPANVSATGVLTIPMMKRTGFTPQFAGGIEATASCVGQIMPPIMGVGAFIMSEITGIAYSKIMLAAVVPSFLFIFSLVFSVALEAARENIQPHSGAGESLEMTKERLAQGITLLFGFGTLLALLFSGYAPTFCGLMSTVVVLISANIFTATRMDHKKFVTFFVDSGKDGLSVMVSCAAIGIIIAAVSTTGLGIKINQLIVALGQQNLLLALLLSAVCSILLGMGLPTAASYLMVVFVAGPAMMKLGVELLQTHLFVFYYAVLSAITPPVALAVFAAAAIAKVSPVRLAGNALRLSIVAFFLPLAWVYHPEINLQNITLETAIPTLGYVVCLLAAALAVAAGHIGYFKGHLSLPLRVLLFVGGGMILSVDWYIIGIGVAIISVILWANFSMIRSASYTV
jgi:TRAP transporter 4TM/12TM fusion protein